jgi:MFS family permease
MATLLRFPSNVLLMILFSFLSVAAVVFTPGLPELSNTFNLSNAQTQWIMTVFLAGAAIGRIPYGVLANRFGRKKTLFIGLYISLVGTLIIVFSETYFWLCIGRFIQALGCASALKITYTMIADLHAGAEATKVLGYSGIAYAILPGIGTAISGYLMPIFGWKGGFWFFLLFNVLVILSCLALPETVKKIDRHALKLKPLLRAYSRQFKDIFLILCSISMGLTTAVLFIFAQEAPFIGIEILGISSEEYGVLYLVPALGIAAGSLLTSWLATKISPSKAMLLGIALLFFGSVSMGLLLILWRNAWALFLPAIILQLGDVILYNNASSKALTEAKDKSNASAVMLFINSCGGFLGTFIVGVFVPRSLIGMPLVFCLMTFMMFIIWLILHNECRKIDKRIGEKTIMK